MVYFFLILRVCCPTGELPLSLAACTNQPEMVSFLLENPYTGADPTDRDSKGNTVLHTLAVIADDTAENTEIVADMYDQILVQHYKLQKGVQLETLVNSDGLTPLKLAAKLGKIGVRRGFHKSTPRLLLQGFTVRWCPPVWSLYSSSFSGTCWTESSWRRRRGHCPGSSQNGSTDPFTPLFMTWAPWTPTKRTQWWR